MYSQNAEFAKRIQELRKKYNLTQQQLADKISVRKTTICNYEKGYSTPTIATIQKLMKCFNLEASYFIPENDFNKKNITKLQGSSIPYFSPENTEGLILGKNSHADSSVTLPSLLKIPRDDCIATCAPDNSMNLCGIKKNYCVIINKTRLMYDGCIFAAIWNNELVLRKYHQNEEKAFMCAESTKIPSGESIQIIPEENFNVLGIVTNCIIGF